MLSAAECPERPDKQLLSKLSLSNVIGNAGKDEHGARRGQEERETLDDGCHEVNDSQHHPRLDAAPGSALASPLEPAFQSDTRPPVRNRCPQQTCATKRISVTVDPCENENQAML